MQPNAKVGLAGKAVSTDEIIALLNVHEGATRKPDRSLWDTLVAPHPETHGLGRNVELACTVVAFPLVIAGYVGLATKFWGRRTRDANYSELGAVAAMALFGAPVLHLVLSMAGVSSAIWLTCGSLVALFARAWIRIRMSAKRDLHRLAKPDAVSAVSALPVASANPTPVAPSNPTHVAPIQTSAPTPVALASLDDGPSLLK